VEHPTGEEIFPEKTTCLKQSAGQSVSYIVVMEDASVITSLPHDPAILKQIIAREREAHRRRTERLSHRVDELGVAKLRLEMELLRLKKWHYGPRADRLQTSGEVAQMLLAFTSRVWARSRSPAVKVTAVYADPNRTMATYAKTLGLANAVSFLAAPQNRRGSYDARLTAASFNAYIRAGFKVTT
jgi:hypothetical protein